MDQPWKRPSDAFLIAVDFSTWPIQPGETVVNSNVRGTLGVVARDSLGADVSGELVEAPVIIGTDLDQVAFIIKAGTAGQTYEIEVTAPTSDEELLTSVFYIDVRTSYRAVA